MSSAIQSDILGELRQIKDILLRIERNVYRIS